MIFMARLEDTTKFNAKAHKETVKKMEIRSESVHAEGQRIYKETGKLDQSVNIFGVVRTSRNAFVRNPDGTFTLKNGIKLPVISKTDGTGSMGENVAKAFYAMGGLYTMLNRFDDRYQIDLSVSVIQDVQDKHPVLQMAEFESDNRAAEHVKKLVPDMDGGDPTEDYDLGLWYVDNKVETDITRYGLKGYFFLIADAIGRGNVYAEDVEKHLGHEMQAESTSTKDICRNLIKKWHLFFIQVKGQRDATSWWGRNMGDDRVIVIDNSDLLAEVQSALVYVTETAQPSEAGLKEFLKDSSNKRFYENDVAKVWQWVQAARSLFGAQAKLPGYGKIPKPGDVFADYRDVWPIGHLDESINETKIDWTKF